MGLAIAGGVMMFLGFLFSLTVIGAIIGIPMIVGGAIMIGVGMFGRRRTMITNVVQVSSAPVGLPVPANTVSLGSALAAEPAAKMVRSPDPATACAACSTANDAASRFCKNCGASLAAAPA